MIAIEDVKERKKEKKPGKEAKKKAPKTSKKEALPADKPLSVEELSKKWPNDERPTTNDSCWS